MITFSTFSTLNQTILLQTSMSTKLSLQYISIKYKGAFGYTLVTDLHYGFPYSQLLSMHDTRFGRNASPGSIAIFVRQTHSSSPLAPTPHRVLLKTSSDNGGMSTSAQNRYRYIVSRLQEFSVGNSEMFPRNQLYKPQSRSQAAQKSSFKLGYSFSN